MPGTQWPWPEGEFYGYQAKYYAWHFDYQGPMYGWSTMPDQYVLDFIRHREMKTASQPLLAASIMHFKKEGKKKKTVFMMLLDQFKDFMIIALFICLGLMLWLAWVRLKAVDIALAEAAIGAGLTALHKTSATAPCTCTMSNEDGLSMCDQRLCRLNLGAHIAAENLN
jgi:hypothetical protein